MEWTLEVIQTMPTRSFASQCLMTLVLGASLLSTMFESPTAVGQETGRGGLLGLGSRKDDGREPVASNSLDDQDEPMDENTRAWNIPLPTLGGKQFWTDYRWWNGWRLQYNSTLDHWRVISPNNIRRAWGGKIAMAQEFESLASTELTQSYPTHVVLLAHGLFRSSGSMQPIADEFSRVEALHPEEPHHECISFAYASTRNSIREHAAAMREFVEHLPGEPRLSFVGHSLGNIVFRAMIGDLQRNGDPKNILGRLHRAVMLGPPNNGSAFAASLSRLGIFETLTGSTGKHLGPEWAKIQDELGVPPCPFAIVIGDISGSPIQNPLIEGASDGVVTVAEATLDEAVEIRSFPSIHSFLMSNKEIAHATVEFLRGGNLVGGAPVKTRENSESAEPNLGGTNSTNATATE